MDVDRLEAIIDWMRRSPLQELEVADGDFRVKLARGGAGEMIAAPAAPKVEPAAGSTVVAPSYGIVHMASTPDAAPFVQVGSAVEAGQPLCVLEAMKVFTPLEAERSGAVVAILVDDGAEVSAGQPLFRLD